MCLYLFPRMTSAFQSRSRTRFQGWDLNGKPAACGGRRRWPKLRAGISLTIGSCFPHSMDPKIRRAPPPKYIPKLSASPTYAPLRPRVQAITSPSRTAQLSHRSPCCPGPYSAFSKQQPMGLLKYKFGGHALKTSPQHWLRRPTPSGRG